MRDELALAGIVDVTGNSEIDQVAQHVESAIIVPAHVTVRVEVFRYNRARDIRIAVDMNICARRIDGRSKISGRRNRDALGHGRISGADAVDPEVTSETGLIHNIPRFHVDITVDIECKVDVRADRNLLRDVARYMDSHVGFCSPEGVHRQF